MIYYGLAALPKKDSGRALCIGVFDGYHMGHQQIIHELINQGKKANLPTALITFRPHPRHTLYPDRKIGLLDPEPQRIERLHSLVDDLVIIDFSLEFASLSGEEFLERLFEKSENAILIQGKNFRFGSKNHADIETIKVFIESRTKQCWKLISVSYPCEDGLEISSTRIRQHLQSTQLHSFKKATKMLGRPYRITEKVVIGNQLGKKIGFPTTNQNPQEQLLPNHGVYATEVKIGPATRAAMTYIGPRHIGKERHILVETHIFDFEGDLYGQTLSVDLIEYIRPTYKLDSDEKLRFQLKADEKACRDLLGMALSSPH